jgi:serine/threonine-protein kinase RsbT
LNRTPVDDVRVAIRTDADVVTARQEARAMGAGLGFSGTDLTLLATAISEIARNITTYAGEGEVALRVLDDGGRQGIEVVATDDGPGNDVVELAMQDGFTTGNGLGLGLPGTRRLVDEFELRTQPGSGTLVRLVKWSRA